MIINISRYKTRKLCKRKSFNTYHRKLTSPSRSMNLVDGSAFHDGVAHGLATRDWKGALVSAREKFDQEKQAVVSLPGQEWLMEDHWDMAQKMIECYADAYKDQGIQVIQPECEFDVELPNSHHNCIWLHHEENIPGVGWMQNYGPPDPKAILEQRVRSPHGNHFGSDYKYRESCMCWQPHRFVGKTDAVVTWMNNIWLLEHKTTAISGEMFWNQWRLDVQPTGYIYGIQKALNVKVGGFILNAIIKPSEAQVANWNKKRKYGPPQTEKDYIKYEREAFLRSKEDLVRFEQDLIDECNDWERDVVRGRFPMSPLAGICNQYNRQCEYHTCCVTHDSQNELDALGKKDDDYVDVKTFEGVKSEGVNG